MDERPTYLSDALPEGQAAALAFAIAALVFFAPVITGILTDWFTPGLVWASAGFAVAVFIVAWVGLTRTGDKRTWPATTRPADWETES